MQILPFALTVALRPQNGRDIPGVNAVPTLSDEAMQCQRLKDASIGARRWISARAARAPERRRLSPQLLQQYVPILKVQFSGVQRDLWHQWLGKRTPQLLVTWACLRALEEEVIEVHAKEASDCSDFGQRRIANTALSQLAEVAD